MQNDLAARDNVSVDFIDWRDRDETSTMDFADFKEARAVFERRFLCNALRLHDSVIAQVAEATGMSRKNLYIKLEPLDIDYDRYRKCDVNHMEVCGSSAFCIFSYCLRR